MLYEMADRPEGAAKAHGKPRPLEAHELPPRVGTWGFFTNHLLLVVAMALNSGQTVRDLALGIGITERAVVGIVNQLEDEGIVSRTREGRRNSYRIDFDAFHDFRGWHFGSWSIPAPLIDVATNGIRALALAGAAPSPK